MCLISKSFLLMKNRMQTAINFWDFAENPSDKEEGDKHTGFPPAMEISEASFELLSTDKLPHVFQVPIVRKTLKCVVYKMNCLAAARGGGVAAQPPASPDPPLPSHFYPLLLPYKDLLESVCSV